MKECNICHTLQAEENFPRTKRGLGPPLRHCRSCESKRVMAWRQRQREGSITGAAEQQFQQALQQAAADRKAKRHRIATRMRVRRWREANQEAEDHRYVRAALAKDGVSQDAITSDLIATKVQELVFKRIARQLLRAANITKGAT